MKTLTFSLLLISSFGFAQDRQEIDSLKHELAIVKHDTNRVLVLERLCQAYRFESSDSGRIYGQQGMDLAQQIKFQRGEAIAYQTLGNFYRLKGDLPKALALLFKALQIAEKEQYLHELGRCLNRIGNVYIELYDYTNAIFYQKRALKIFESIQNKDGVINTEAYIGETYERNNQLDSAAIYFQKAYKKVENSKFALKHAYLLRCMGSLQFKLGNRRKAFEYLHESIQINKINNDYNNGTLTFNTLAEFFKELNQRDSCIYYAKKALAEAQSIGLKNGILDASALLAEQLESKDLKEAHNYLKLAKATNDDLYGRQKVQVLQKILSEEQKRQRQVELENEKHQNQLMQYAFLAGLGIFLLIVFILYRNNKKQKEANILLHHQKEEINLKSKQLENSLKTLKATQAQLIQSEKLASLGELTAGIAHEIQNPLNFVNNFSELSVDLVKDLKEEIEKPTQDKEYIGELFDDLSQNHEKINHHGKRASSIVKGMLEHSRASTGVRELTDINKLADEYLRLSYHGLRAKDKNFNADYKTEFQDPLSKIEVIPQDMGRVLLNLINNAFYAVHEKMKQNTEGGYLPTVTVTTQQLDNQIIIKVKDNGIGMPESVKTKVFQPFFTTKPTGQGTGLGLSLAYDIVTKGHGGELKVESKEGEFTEFIIKLPS